MSAPQAAVLQTIGIGVEDTSGTVVPATHQLQALQIAPAQQLDIEMFGPMGSKHDALAILNREWVQAGLSGKPTYTEIVFPLSSAITRVTPTQVEVEIDEETDPGPTTEQIDAWEWVFESESFDADNPHTFSVEKVGTNGFAEGFGYGIITDFGIEINRNTTNLTGTLVGQTFETGITPVDAGDLEALDLVPILPGHFNVYMDDDYEDLGTTQLLSDYMANFNVGGKFGTLWPLNRNNASYSEHVDLKPTITLALRLERNVVGMTPLAALRQGAKKFIRVEALGPVIDTYTFTPDVGDPEEREVRFAYICDFCGEVSATTDGEETGLKTVDWTFSATNSPGWGKAYSILVRNNVSTLAAAA